MRITLQEKYLAVLILVFSVVMLIANIIFTRVRHETITYHKYFHRKPQRSFSNIDHHDTHISLSEESNEHSRRILSSTLYIASSYTIFNEVIPRTAYYESKLVDSVWQGILVVLAEVKHTIIEDNLIISCQVNNQFSTHLKVIPDPLMNWIKTRKKGYTHFFTLIYCYGFKKETAQGTDSVSIIYRTHLEGSYRSVKTESSLKDNLHTIMGRVPGSVVVCATMYGHPARFDEWLRYQKTIGINMVHVSAQVSFMVSMEQYPFLAESLMNGFVKIQVWKEYLKEDQIFYHSQSLVYQDCLMQYKHKFEYVMMIDYDDFFIPVISKKTDIHYYIDKFFTASTGSVRLPWIQYHCKPMNYTSLVDGNVTSILSGQDLNKRLESKSIHRSDAVEIVSIHRAYKTKPGHRIEKINGVNLTYFAHIRPSKRRCRM